MKTIKEIKQEIMNDNRNFTEKGWEPIFRAYKKSKILIIGQAPGLKTQETNDVFRDQSGDRLRDWMGIDETMFYDSHLISVLPMDFYFPGKAKTGDKPPRKGFAQKWHPILMEAMPHIELIILIGGYAQKYYLGKGMKRNLTETVKSFSDYGPKYFPLVHPSPLNRRWESKNAWFKKDVLHVFYKSVHEILF